MTEQAAIPVYRSHKTVGALEIASCVKVEGAKRICTFRDPGHAPMTIEAEVFARYRPEPGDFLVIYADGYKSVSPRQAFLDGYSRV